MPKKIDKANAKNNVPVETNDNNSAEKDIASYSLHYRSHTSDAGVNIYLQLAPDKLTENESVLELDTSTEHLQRAEYASGNTTRFFVAKHVLDDDVASKVSSIKLNSKIELKVEHNSNSTDENWQVFSYQSGECVHYGEGKTMEIGKFFEVLHQQYELTQSHNEEQVNNE